jgi:hypothetical protein
MRKYLTWISFLGACIFIVLFTQKIAHAFPTISDEYLQLFDKNKINAVTPCQSDGTSSNSCVGTLPGSNNEEIVWNYFVEANIDGVSNNPAAIAGIMGNFQQESNFNPFATTGQYYGIFQTSKSNKRGEFKLSKRKPV